MNDDFTELDPRLLPGEEWRSIPGFPDLEASDCGRIRLAVDHLPHRKGKILSQRIRMSRGTPYRMISQNTEPGHRIELRVHRLLLAAFKGPAPSRLYHAAHWNGNSLDNRIDNLRWATPKENNGDDQKRLGRTPRGERQGAAKLTEADVKAIHYRLSTGVMQRRIAEEFSVTEQLISRIKKRLCWKHVPEMIDVG